MTEMPIYQDRLAEFCRGIMQPTTKGLPLCNPLQSIPSLLNYSKAAPFRKYISTFIAFMQAASLKELVMTEDDESEAI